MLRGSCLCGGVRYEVTGPLRGALNCHCSMCRKAHGAAFRSRAGVKVEDLRWVQGEDLLTWYETSPGTHRGVQVKPIFRSWFRSRKSPTYTRPAIVGRVQFPRDLRSGMHLGAPFDVTSARRCRS